MRIARIIDADDQPRLVCEEADGTFTAITGDPLAPGEKTGDTVTVKSWLSPVSPTTIIGIGLNYRKHAEEGGFAIPEYPVVFMKNPMAATGHAGPIRIPRVCDDEVDFEAELAVVIGKTCRNVSEADALDYVAGYTAANDVSARIWQTTKGGTQWNRAKGFDTFAPLGPVMVTPDELPNANALSIRSILNGEVMQDSTTADMIFNIPTLIRFLSENTTLLPGTVILTGTPEGIGWARDPKRLLHAGDEITIEIEQIGKLTNSVE